MAKDLDGKIFLVTGATGGIGRAAALEFAQRGATLTIVGRSKEKGEELSAELKAQCGNEKHELILADMSKLADIRSVADQFLSRHDRLDVLVNNAGGIFMKRETSPDGLEMTFALNHLGYFLLTSRLLELLKKSGTRVVSTSSGAHQMGKIELDDIARREKGYSGWRAYGDSKLANILFTRELARRLSGSAAVANCVHPGWVNTGFGAMAKVIEFAAWMMARSPEKGAETLVWLATSPEAGKLNGEYCHDLQIAKVSSAGRDDAMAARLWELSEKICAKA
jgi:NAD(P)-dependent dehydrogenase (short-subunit alcohol dehydrogenase family)